MSNIIIILFMTIFSFFLSMYTGTFGLLSLLEVIIVTKDLNSLTIVNTELKNLS
jgi:hypothetical protein